MRWIDARRHASAPTKLRLLLITAALALSAAACAAQSDDGDGAAAAGDEAISQDDLVDVDDLLAVEDDSAGAITVGEAAWILSEARKQARRDVETIKSALLALKAAAQSSEPKVTKTLNKLSYAMWEGNRDGHTFRLHVFRITGKRLRYTLTGQQDGKGAFKTLLTGIFVKRGARKGGGRLHISLDNLAKVGGVAATGSIHLWFANHDSKARGRRIVYRNVKLADNDGPAWNYGADYVHKFGVGGRYRTVLIGDIDKDLDGTELLALRVRWALGLGGRADAIFAHVAPPPVSKLAGVHECWDAKGLRSAYKDDFAGNDKDNPDAGDVSSCAGFAIDEVPEGVAAADAKDKDPELDALLADAEADDIDESEADKATTEP